VPHAFAAMAAAALVTGMVGCSSVDEVSVGLVIAVAAEPPTALQRAADGTLTLTTDRGYQVHLERAYLVSTSVEVVPCSAVVPPPAARAAPAGGRVLGWLGRALIGRAEAHTPGTPTRLGTAFVESLAAAPDVRVTLGEIRPPPDRYCRLSYTASPADHDAVGMPSDSAALGNTIYLQGTFARGSDAAADFTVAAPMPFTVSADVEPLDLTEGAPPPTVVIRKQADHWLDGVDFATAPARVIARTVIDNIQRSIRLERR
jgi:hypothetical protein